MDKIKDFISNNLVDVCVKFAVTVLIIVIGFWIVKLIMKAIRKGKLYGRLDASVKTFVDSAVSLVLKIVVVVTAITYAGVPMATVITIIGSLGVTVGLALQGGLSNIAGGVLILVNRPFKAGDYIKVGEYDGIVEDISLFYTKIKTYDAKKIVIPNGTVTSSVVVNNFENATRRVDLPFSASYSSDIDLVKKTLLEVAAANPRVLKDPAPRAIVTEHADSAVKYALWAWVKTEDFWDAKFELTEDVKKAFDKAGIVIPFPQLDVHNK